MDGGALACSPFWFPRCWRPARRPTVWTGVGPRPGETEVAWEIIDLPAGTVGEMRAPLDLRPLHIGTDFMIVLRSDTLDVERVGLFDLLREDPGS